MDIILQKKKDKSFKYFIFSILVKLILELIYLKQINPLFEYSGFDLDFNYFKYFEGWIIYLISLYFLPKKIDRPSSCFLSIQFFIFTTPLLIYYSFTNSNRYHLYIMILGIFIPFFVRNFSTISLPILKSGKIIAILISIFTLAFTIFYLFILSGPNTFNLNIEKVYAFREITSESIYTGYFAYFIGWGTKTFIPFLITFCILKKKRIAILLLLFLSLFMFGATSHKAIFIYPFLVIFLSIFLSKTRSLFTIPLSISIIGALSFAVQIFFSKLGFFITSFLIRRTLFIPPFLSFKYYEFFSQNQKVYWSSSFLSRIIKYPYQLSPPNLIGDYLGDFNAHANNTYISTGFMHAGILGVILYGIILGIIFAYIDNLTKYNIPDWIIICTLITPMITIFTSTDLLNSFLTHGLLISLLLITLLKTSNKDYKVKNLRKF